MFQRDLQIEERLSAYLDGELPPDERRVVEDLLASDADSRRYLEELRAIQAEVQGLPSLHLDAGFADRVLAAIDLQRYDELLSGFVDGELSAADREYVQRWLARDPVARQTFEEFRELHERLRSLPKYRLDADFADRVIARIEQQLAEAENGKAPAASVTPASLACPTAAESQRSSGDWRRSLIWPALVVVAATLLLAFSLMSGDSNPPPPIAKPGDPPATLPHDGSSQPEAKPEIVQAKPQNVQRPQRKPDANLQLVQAVRKQAARLLILVYEVSVTPEGVQDAAFADLLRRHNIRFHQTYSVGAEEQADLLKHQFLQGAKPADPKAEGVDEVQLYIVRCQAWQAEDMYFDLMSRPQGIASFGLNLSSLDANKGVLGRLCQATADKSEIGQATQLLAGLAMLSSAGRNVGMFGKLAVDPALYNPPQKPVPDGGPVPADGNAAAAVNPLPNGDIPVELLFVVRNLKPLKDDAKK